MARTHASIAQLVGATQTLLYTCPAGKVAMLTGIHLSALTGPSQSVRFWRGGKVYLPSTDLLLGSKLSMNEHDYLILGTGMTVHAAGSTTNGVAVHASLIVDDDTGYHFPVDVNLPTSRTALYTCPPARRAYVSGLTVSSSLVGATTYGLWRASVPWMASTPIQPNEQQVLQNDGYLLLTAGQTLEGIGTLAGLVLVGNIREEPV
jgi:hypothetical protein